MPQSSARLDAAAFWRQVERTPSGCWWWTGPTDRRGYGVWHAAGASYLAHRAAALLAGYPLAQLGRNHCGHRRCCNPAHWRWRPSL